MSALRKIRTPRIFERVRLGVSYLTHTIYVYQYSKKNPNLALHKLDVTKEAIIAAAEHLLRTDSTAKIEIDGKLYELEVHPTKDSVPPPAKKKNGHQRKSSSSSSR